MTITVQKYTFNCRFITEARLPGYLGSTLRGSLGWSLKKTSCVLRRQQCDSCLLRKQCAYAFIFETEKYTVSTRQTVNARPHPFVLQPGETLPGMKKRGETFHFSLRLFGHANTLLPQIVYSIRMMGETGIGAGRRDGLGRFLLETVTTDEKTIFSAEDEILHTHATGGTLCLANDREKNSTETKNIRLTLQTPLRLKSGNRLTRELPFHILIRAALRRIASLEEAYGGGEPDLDYRGLVNTAEKIKMFQSTICWKELFRYSNRQRKKISLSGLCGTVGYRDVPGTFLPILQYSEKVNIGKPTVFGLVKIHIT